MKRGLVYVSVLAAAIAGCGNNSHIAEFASNGSDAIGSETGSGEPAGGLRGETAGGLLGESAVGPAAAGSVRFGPELARSTSSHGEAGINGN
jgi:hypothetical protein